MAQRQFFELLDRLCSSTIRSGSPNADTLSENAADLSTDSVLLSTFRAATATIRHARNNWVCYDFKEKRIVSTHYAIRLYWNHQDGCHMKSRPVEPSADGKTWREVAREEDSNRINGSRTFLRSLLPPLCFDLVTEINEQSHSIFFPFARLSCVRINIQ
jgi:hypothetical protein